MPNAKGLNQHSKAFTWSTTDTTVVRVPTKWKAQLLEIARHLDAGGDVLCPDLFTGETGAAAVKPTRKRGTPLRRKKVLVP